MPCVETPCVEATSESGSKRAVTSQLMNMELLPTTAAQLPAAVYNFACKCVQIAMGLLGNLQQRRRGRGPSFRAITRKPSCLISCSHWLPEAAYRFWSEGTAR